MQSTAAFGEYGRFYTVFEVAAILNIGRDSVMRLVHSGKLKAMKYPRMGGRGRNVKWMVAECDLKDFIDRNRGGAAA
jgi:excisionase family DNA binding protein